ncbi:unnamed protein product, partial [marine sediment metagenome]
AYEWSPDSKRIAYTMNNPETEEEKKNKREKLDMKVLNTNYKYSHLYTITIDKDSEGERKVKRLTSGNFHITAFDWSPDGKTIAYEHHVNPTADVWISADISSVSSDSGAVRPLVSWKGADRFPHYSPDGKWLAFVSDGGNPSWALLSDVFIMPSQGGKPKQLALTPDRSFTYYGRFIGWSSDSKEMYVRESSRTFWRIFAVPVNGEKTRMVTTWPGTFISVSFSKNGKIMAFVYQT